MKIVNKYVHENIHRRKEVFYFFAQALDAY